MKQYIHEATTIQIASAFPFVASKPLATNKIFIGRDLVGGVFLHDPFELYKSGTITSPNMIVIGQIGRGKSSLIKTYLYREAIFDRQIVVLDPKGEYGPLARALGFEPIYLYPGGPYRLNPLDVADDVSDSGPSDSGPENSQKAGNGYREGVGPIRKKLELLIAICISCMKRELYPIEYTALEHALSTLGKRYTTILLTHIVQELLDPSDDGFKKIGITREEIILGSRDVALELRRLVYGELAGMFDAPTSQSLKLSRNVFVLDLSALYNSPALGVMMACATAFVQSFYTNRENGKTFLVVDEAWALLQNPGIARFLQASWKLARSRGMANIAIFHRISDLDASGEYKSLQNQIGNGIVADSETVVCYAQPHQEIDRASDDLGITKEEASLLPNLRKGIALWKVGSRTYLVEHKLSKQEKYIVDTDSALTAP